MSRSLTWFLQKPHRVASSVGQGYLLNEQYDVAYAWVHAKVAPGENTVRIDILADGTTILSNMLALSKGETSTEQYTIAVPLLKAGQYITIDLLQIDGTVGDLTIGLELT